MINYGLYFWVYITAVVVAMDLKVEIDTGVLEGQYVNGLTRTFSSFTKIPYAEPPLNKLRFAAPRPALPWKGTLNAKLETPLCPQIKLFTSSTLTGEEDCLYLNVFTPKVERNETNNLPVMVFFHGGSFRLGAATTLKPHAFLEKNIVLVTVSYRLGALGFLSTGDEASPGNNGLKDQNLSIQWVKKHIHHFGGNPNKITIFGQSVGGGSAYYHMLSPLSNDLINGVICQSGIGNAKWTFGSRDEGKFLSKKFAKLLNCSTDYSHVMVECLRKVSSRDILLTQLKLSVPNISKSIPTFRPVIEPEVRGAFLTQPSLDIIKSGNFTNVPFMVGITANEGCMCTVDHCQDRTAITKFNRHFDEIISQEIGIDYRIDKKYITREVKRFYFKNQTLTCDDKGRTNISNMYTDALFLDPINEVLELYLKYNLTSLYHYNFEYKSTTLPSTSAAMGDPLHDYGVCHSDDMNYFSCDPNSLKHYSPKDRAVVERMVNMWTNFAIYGNPTPLDGEWKTVKTKDLEYYAIKGPQGGKMSKRLHGNRADFWRHLQVYLRNLSWNDTMIHYWLYFWVYIPVVVFAAYPKVGIDSGVLEGKYVNGLTRTFSSFTKIPYAEPPLNQLRFAAPRPARPWKGILNAKLEPPVCPQMLPYENSFPRGEEDCLYLNVFTPKVEGNDTNGIPVMIFFHGGSFRLGAATMLKPYAFLEANIVLVTVNYRLGAFGFLSTGDEASPGNYGLKDQNLSIQWVKRHIHHFGGNPNKITIFGQSVGGASAHYHMLSPLSKDLINGVICQSGLGNAKWMFEPRDEGKYLAKKLAKLLNCSTDYSHGMVECLRNVSAREIVLTQLKLPLPNIAKSIPIFKPVIEPDVTGAFLTQHPLDIIRKGNFAKVPFMLGITANDGCMCISDHCGDRMVITEFHRHFDEIISKEIGIDHRMDKKDITREIKRFYFKHQMITCNDKGRADILNMYTDALFLAPINEVLELYLKYNHTSLYNYDFEYKSTTLPSSSAIIGDTLHDYGVCHSDDMNYFSCDPNSLKHYSPNDRAMVDRMVNMWTNFAIYGNPTPFDEAWKTVKTNDLEYYAIEGPQGGKMSKRLHSKRADFWRHLQRYL
ncbi:uncharacterized protein LOC116170681 [Photinus pyralis]|uniref:uncharacterized protein LOC116170681 n=1 Tax=Photinus pyralis TaxID=7054 RepID=UPI0012674421|nr:uncharacterized protein LOC116170681 [Photinus pyralis]